MIRLAQYNQPHRYACDLSLIALVSMVTIIKAFLFTAHHDKERADREREKVVPRDYSRKSRSVFRKLFFGPNWYLQILAYTHAKFERLEHLLKGRARCLKAAT